MSSFLVFCLLCQQIHEFKLNEQYDKTFSTLFIWSCGSSVALAFRSFFFFFALSWESRVQIPAEEAKIRTFYGTLLQAFRICPKVYFCMLGESWHNLAQRGLKSKKYDNWHSFVNTKFENSIFFKRFLVQIKNRLLYLIVLILNVWKLASNFCKLLISVWLPILNTVIVEVLNLM